MSRGFLNPFSNYSLWTHKFRMVWSIACWKFFILSSLIISHKNSKVGHGGDGVEGARKGLEWEAWFTCLEIFSRHSKGRAEFHAPPQAPQGLWHFPISRLSQSSRRLASAPGPRDSAQPDGTSLTFPSWAAHAAIRASSAQATAECNLSRCSVLHRNVEGPSPCWADASAACDPEGPCLLSRGLSSPGPKGTKSWPAAI